jgi:hypothetical protein
LANGERWKQHIVNEVSGVCRKVDHLALSNEGKTYAFIENLFGVFSWKKVRVSDESNEGSVLRDRLSLTPFRYGEPENDRILGKFDQTGDQDGSLAITQGVHRTAERAIH